MHTSLLKILEKEQERQKYTLDMIASENFSSRSVRRAVGSVFMHKYAEGYVGARYYEGNEFIDELEALCIKMIFKVFDLDEKVWHANVQVLSGSVANLAVFLSILEPGDKILSMYLPDGGHLSHGWSFVPKDERKESDEKKMFYKGGSRVVSQISKLYKVVQYKTDPKTGEFDYDFIQKLAEKEKPKLLISGGTAYPKDIDYKRMSEIAHSVGALYLADVAHEAGLIAGEVLSSPFEDADFVTFTTHKTLRGPKGAVAMCKKEYAQALDRAVFPGLQGGPFMHSIAGLTQALFEADTPEFKEYASLIVRNAKVLANELITKDYKLMSAGTEKHLIVVDLSDVGILGAKAAKALYETGIVCNKTTVPYEKNTPMNPSGIRLGTPSLSTRGMGSEQMVQIAEIIDKVINAAKGYAGKKDVDFEEEIKHDEAIRAAKDQVTKLCEEFPLDS